MSGISGLLEALLVMLGFLVMIIPVVSVHELGHYVVARALGIPCPVFSIGAGRELVGFTAFGTRWRFAPILLLAYVKPDEQAYAAAHPLKRLAILLAGPGANFLLAFILLVAFIVTQGVPPLSSVTIAWDFVATTAANIADQIALIFSLDSSGLGGPIAIGESGKEAISAALQGTERFAAWTPAVYAAAISVAMGVLNLVPVPKLDGGESVIALGEIITRRRLSQRSSALVGLAGAAAVFALVVLIVGQDFVRLWIEDFNALGAIRQLFT